MVDRTYLRRFEYAVMSGLLNGRFAKKHSISVKPSRLIVTAIVNHLGVTINSGMVFAIDYYGYLKKSIGFYTWLTEIRKDQIGQIRFVEIPVVFLNSVKYEDLIFLDTRLVDDFQTFKRQIQALRGIQNTCQKN